MSYQVVQHNSVQVVRLHQLLHESDNRAILDEIEQKIRLGFRNFVFDFSKIQFLNSVGINLLLSVLKKTQQTDGELALANLSDNLVKLLQMTKLESVFSVRANLQDALSSFQYGLDKEYN